MGHLKPWLSWTLEEPSSLEATRARLRRWSEEHQGGRTLRFAIVPFPAPATILGGVSLGSRVGPGERDLGYWVSRSSSGRGIAGSAVSALAIHAFDTLATGRLVLRCDVANARSAGFAAALGFEPAGTATLSYPDGSPRAVLRFDMDRDRYGRLHSVSFRRRAEQVSIQTT